MSKVFETPSLEELGDLPDLDLSFSEDDHFIVYASAWSNDGDRVTVSWEKLTASVSATWLREGVEICRISRDGAEKISVEKCGGGIHFHAWFNHHELKGEISILATESISVRDVLLRS